MTSVQVYTVGDQASMGLEVLYERPPRPNKALGRSQQLYVQVDDSSRVSEARVPVADGPGYRPGESVQVSGEVVKASKVKDDRDFGQMQYVRVQTSDGLVDLRVSHPGLSSSVDLQTAERIALRDRRAVASEA